MKIVIIVGTHRTGTKSVARYFGRYYNNAHSFHQYGGLRLINIATNLRLAGFIGEKVFGFIVKKVMCSHIAKNADKEVYLLSNGFCLTAANKLKEYYDDVRIVHLVRDPRDFLTSYFNFIHTRFKSRIANSVIPFWQPNGYLINEMRFKEWYSLTKHQQYSWNWHYKNRLISELYNQGSEPYLFIKLEELENRETRSNSLRKLVDITGMNFAEGSEVFFDKPYNKSKGNKLENWTQWNSVFAQKMNAYFLPLMKIYGYGGEIEWESKLKCK